MERARISYPVICGIFTSLYGTRSTHTGVRHSTPATPPMLRIISGSAHPFSSARQTRGASTTGHQVGIGASLAKQETKKHCLYNGFSQGIHALRVSGARLLAFGQRIRGRCDHQGHVRRAERTTADTQQNDMFQRDLRSRRDPDAASSVHKPLELAPLLQRPPSSAPADTISQP